MKDPCLKCLAPSLLIALLVAFVICAVGTLAPCPALAKPYTAIQMGDPDTPDSSPNQGPAKSAKITVAYSNVSLLQGRDRSDERRVGLVIWIYALRDWLIYSR